MTDDDQVSTFLVIVFAIVSFVASVVGLTVAGWVMMVAGGTNRPLTIVGVIVVVVAIGYSIFRGVRRSAARAAVAVGALLGLIVFGGCLATILHQ